MNLTSTRWIITISCDQNIWYLSRSMSDTPSKPCWGNLRKDAHVFTSKTDLDTTLTELMGCYDPTSLTVEVIPVSQEALWRGSSS